MEPQHDWTPEEKEAPPERREEEDATTYPGHENPERVINPDPDEP